MLECSPQSSALVWALVCQRAQDAALGRIEAHACDQHAAAALQDLGPAQHDRRAVRMLQDVVTLAREMALVDSAHLSTISGAWDIANLSCKKNHVLCLPLPSPLVQDYHVPCPSLP